MKINLKASKYSLLGHEEIKALYKEIYVGKYVSMMALEGIIVFNRIRKKDSLIIEQNQLTMTKILSCFSVTDASRFSRISKEINI